MRSRPSSPPGPVILVDTLGPFQVRNLALPRRCAERGIHYIDIADASTRVVDIASLDAVARVEHAAIISGASTVPALTTAVVDELVPNAREVVAIDVGITPVSARRAAWPRQGDPRLLRQADPARVRR